MQNYTLSGRCRGENGFSLPGQSPQRVSGKDKFLDSFSADQMFLNDAFQNFRRGGIISPPLFAGG
jgi:hypothetical protein